MSNQTTEGLSAFVDDEADRFTGRRLAEALSEDSALQQSWSRYHLIGAVLREEPQMVLREGFVDGITAAIDTEEAYKSSPWQQWLKPAMGVAVAASVAVLSVVSFRAVLFEEQTLETVAVNDVPPAAVAPLVRSVAVATPAVDSVKEMNDAQFNTYLLGHADGMDPVSVLPHARMVAYSSARP